MSIKIIKKLLLILAIPLILPSAVFAETRNGYIPKSYGIPIVYVSRVDMMNNQIEFHVNTFEIDDDAILYIGFFYDENGVDEEKILEHDGLGGDGIRAIFWNYGRSITNNYIGWVRQWNKFIADTAYDLNENNIYEIYMYIKMKDGTSYVDKIDYSKCMNNWEPGMECVEAGFVNAKDVNSTLFSINRAPEKYIFPEKEENISEDENEEENISENENDKEDVLGNENEYNDESDLEIENETDGELNENENELNDETNEEIGELEVENLPSSSLIEEQAVKTETKIQKTDTIIENEDEAIEEEIDYDGHEGPGETTLDVPILGEVEEKKDYVSFLVWLIIGYCIAVSLVLLLFLVKRRKNSRVG